MTSANTADRACIVSDLGLTWVSPRAVASSRPARREPWLAVLPVVLGAILLFRCAADPSVARRPADFAGPQMSGPEVTIPAPGTSALHRRAS